MTHLDWATAATRHEQAFKRACDTALLKDYNKALIQLAESKAWLELCMHVLAREGHVVQPAIP